MADIKQGRWTAEIEGDFVVFIIGARLNSKWQAFKSFADLGGRSGMNHMLKYLTEHPEKGLLGYETMGFVNVQYWRSFEHLEAFAKNTDDPHLDVWRNYWKRVGKDTRSGIWHETYLVRAGEYEAIYGNMPRAVSARRAGSCRSPNRSSPPRSRPRSQPSASGPSRRSTSAQRQALRSCGVASVTSAECRTSRCLSTTRSVDLDGQVFEGSPSRSAQ